MDVYRKNKSLFIKIIQENKYLTYKYMVKKYSQKAGMKSIKKFFGKRNKFNSPTKIKERIMVYSNPTYPTKTRLGNSFGSSSSNSLRNSWNSESQSNNTESNIAREEARKNQRDVIYQNAKDLIKTYSSKSENDLRYFTIEQFKTIIEDILFGLHGKVFEDFKKSEFIDEAQYNESYYNHIEISILNFLDDNELKTLHKLLKLGYNKSFTNKRNNAESFKVFFNYLNTIVMHKYNDGKTTGFITPLVSKRPTKKAPKAPKRRPTKKAPQVPKRRPPKPAPKAPKRRPTKTIRVAPKPPQTNSSVKRPTVPKKPEGLRKTIRSITRRPSSRTSPSRTQLPVPSRTPPSRPPLSPLIKRPSRPSPSTKPKLSKRQTRQTRQTRKNNSSNPGNLTELQEALKKRGIKIVA